MDDTKLIFINIFFNDVFTVSAKETKSVGEIGFVMTLYVNTR